jgi:ATP-dependent helicase HrpA
VSVASRWGSVPSVKQARPILASLASAPTAVYPDLPVSAKRAEIQHALKAHQTIIVCGETGSGKTTQLPKMALECFLDRDGLIGCTQPRRIAARSVAGRIGQEMGAPELVGWKVRFADTVRPSTRIKVMTDGILLAETQGDPMLLTYSTLIIDEAHERSLNIDFLLGYLRQLLIRRADLKLVITSATIDAEKFSRHFGDAPVIEVSGRLYPVEIRYQPLEKAAERDSVPLPLSGGARRAGETPPLLPAIPPSPQPASLGRERKTSDEMLTQAILDATDELARESDGHILVFLPGEREIRDTAEALRKHHPPHTEILPLFSRLSVQEQDRVFSLTNARRIVLATNVAETSLTVPGIRYVIDPGLARVKRYSPRNKVEQLLVEKVSQASANQRAGRCGRVAAGICIRLYDEADFESRPRFSEPELLRSSLAGVILRMKSLTLGSVEDFPFLDSPHPRLIRDGYQLLRELNAVDEAGGLTLIGHKLARLPLDPRIGRMLLAAEERRCLTEILVIASALSVQDPRERPLEAQQAADQAHAEFRDDKSDFLGWVKLWQFQDEAFRYKKSNRQLQNLLRAHFLSPQRVREWREVHGQLHTLATELGMKPNSHPARPDDIHKALLAGLLGHIGFRADDAKSLKPGQAPYRGARDIRFHIHPGSGLSKKQPKWVMAAELTETGRLYARTAGGIQPEWAEEVGTHLLEREYSDPRWDRRRAQVTASERVTLYGLPLVVGRSVHYGAIDPKLSREIFIRNALVAGDYDSRAPWFIHDRCLITAVEEEEHKARRAHTLVDEDRVFAFFDAKLPANIVNGAGFEQWRQEAERSQPKLLFLNREDVLRADAPSISPALYPKTMKIGEVECRLRYRFEPGHPLDGVTLIVPLYLLNQVEAAQCDWLVPGLQREKTTALIKALPKDIRNRCQPPAEFVTGFLTSTEPGPTPMKDALAAFLKHRLSAEIRPEDWRDELPEHLRMNFSVADDKNQELAGGRDLAELRRRFGDAAQEEFSGGDSHFEKTGLTQWDVGDLPREVKFRRAGRELIGYPALVDEETSVALRLLDTRQAADAAHRGGVSRLLRLELAAQMKQVDRQLAHLTELALKYRPLGDADQLREELTDAVADRALLGDDPVPCKAKDFAKQKERAKPRLPVVAAAVLELVEEILDDHRDLQDRLARANAFPHAVQDIRHQISHLIYPGFVRRTPWARLQNLPRYLTAAARRLDKLPGGVDRDRRHTATLAGLWKDYEQRLDKHRKAGIADPGLEEFRWQLEELRVSLFAQELKTPFPVSVKRVKKIWDSVHA